MNKTVPGAARNIAAANRDQVHVNLLGLGPNLRAHAARHGLSIGRAARIAISRMLEDESGADDAGGHGSQAPPADADADSKTRLLLRISPARAQALAARASACGVSRSRYVETLMEGVQPAPLPADHAAMVAALMTATDQIAVLCLDLRAFMRLLNFAPAAELEPYRVRVRSLIGDVQAYLKPAAQLLAELDTTRRWR